MTEVVCHHGRLLLPDIFVRRTSPPCRPAFLPSAGFRRKCPVRFSGAGFAKPATMQSPRLLAQLVPILAILFMLSGLACKSSESGSAGAGRTDASINGSGGTSGTGTGAAGATGGNRGSAGSISSTGSGSSSSTAMCFVDCWMPQMYRCLTGGTAYRHYRIVGVPSVCSFCTGTASPCSGSTCEPEGDPVPCPTGTSCIEIEGADAKDACRPVLDAGVIDSAAEDTGKPDTGSLEAGSADSKTAELR